MSGMPENGQDGQNPRPPDAPGDEGAAGPAGRSARELAGDGAHEPSQRGAAPPHADSPRQEPGPEAGSAPAHREATHDPPGGDPSPDRRRFLTALVAGSGALATGALLLPWAGVFLSPVRRPDAESWHPVGAVEDFPPGETLKVVVRDPAPLPWAGYAGRSAAWIRREEGDRFVAFTTTCTHVGCAVRWEEGARLFLCPCHGGAFHADGRVAAGPPPRPLDRHPIRVRDGRVELQALALPEPSG